MESKYNILAVVGPTASGKTTLAVRLAHKLNGLVISGDSRQVYRGMDLGTGKDIEEYCINGEPVPYRLIDIADAGEKYTVFKFQRDFYKAFEECKELGKFPVLCGGSGLYVQSVISGYKLLDVPQNPELRNELSKRSLPELIEILKGYKTLHNTTECDTCNRAIRAIEIEEFYASHPEAFQEWNFPELRPLIIGTHVDREVRRKRITKRLHDRLDAGMVDEIRQLIAKGTSPEDLIYYGLEYKYITQYVIGELTYDEMVEKLNIAIHQFAKRQMTWFRKMEREGYKIHWVDPSRDAEEIDSYIMKLLAE
ncbi:MAG: tRNA (adenosine(37)-N6)-dimethylallyltransferase MiaA [Bacteroidales bacterium]|nr:tRNA (adenosine(37)-N6)-dimethylallyltransferase MiaA [Bacteroidales bacterium]